MRRQASHRLEKNICKIFIRHLIKDLSELYKEFFNKKINAQPNLKMGNRP